VRRLCTNPAGRYPVGPIPKRSTWLQLVGYCVTSTAERRRRSCEWHTVYKTTHGTHITVGPSLPPNADKARAKALQENGGKPLSINGDHDYWAEKAFYEQRQAERKARFATLDAVFKAEKPRPLEGGFEFLTYHGRLKNNGFIPEAEIVEGLAHRQILLNGTDSDERQWDMRRITSYERLMRVPTVGDIVQSGAEHTLKDVANGITGAENTNNFYVYFAALIGIIECQENNHQASPAETAQSHSALQIIITEAEPGIDAITRRQRADSIWRELNLPMKFA
jgi:hypothetical protein